MESLQGNVLIATPQMPDPRFARQVVYLCSHTEDDGAMGLVINEPSPYSLFEILRAAQMTVSQERQWPPIYIGGPVETECAFFIYSADYKAKHYLEVSPEVHLSRDPKILQDIAADAGPSNYLFVLGYAGWAPGQLEEELSMKGWLTLPGDGDIIFKTPDNLKWKNAAEKYGIDISLFSDEIGVA